MDPPLFRLLTITIGLIFTAGHKIANNTACTVSILLGKHFETRLTIQKSWFTQRTCLAILMRILTWRSRWLIALSCCIQVMQVGGIGRGFLGIGLVRQISHWSIFRNSWA